MGCVSRSKVESTFLINHVIECISRLRKNYLIVPITLEKEFDRIQQVTIIKLSTNQDQK